MGRYLRALSVVALTTALAIALRSLLAVPDPEMVLLAGVAVSALWQGRGPAVLAAALSVAAYNFLFVAPLHTFRVADPRYLLTFAMMFGTGLVLSSLATRLRRTEEVAERARVDRLRAALLSSVSHDLRTPLATITGAGTTLRDEPELPEQARRDLLESICDEAERMERLVANLLEMTRLRAGPVAIARAWVPVEELVGAAMTRLEARLVGRHVTTSIAPDLPLVHVDPILFSQVLVNLIENALKHTPAEASIAVDARLARGGVAIAVADDGPGFGAGETEHVFEQFWRGARARGASAGGAGLGLAICRGVVEAHGGTIAAEHRPGGGAQVVVLLPLRETPPPPPPAERDG